MKEKNISSTSTSTIISEVWECQNVFMVLTIDGRSEPLRTFEGNQVSAFLPSKLTTGVDVDKCLKHVKLPVSIYTST